MPENPSNHAARLTNGCTLGGAVRWGLGGSPPRPLAHTAIGVARSVASWQREGVFYTLRLAFFFFR